MKSSPIRVGLSIPMLPDMELTAAHTAEAMARFIELDEGEIEEVKTALIEACINAIEHSRSEDGRLQIDFEITAGALTILIADRGHGFDVEAVREELRRRRQRGERQRGWGLFLMEELVDEVDVESARDGTTITLVKYR